MADPIQFPGSNLLLCAPDEQPNIQSLPAYCNKVTTTTCWKLSEAELAEINKTGEVYLTVLGHLHPPVLVGSESFIRQQTADYGVWKKGPQK